jgi:hypothetical protein
MSASAADYALIYFVTTSKRQLVARAYIYLVARFKSTLTRPHIFVYS